MGRGIPVPTPPDTGRDVGALYPSHPLVDGHSPVRATDARLIAGRRTTSHAALNAARGRAPISAHSTATWQPSEGLGVAQPLEPEGCNGTPRGP
uniref:Uncharacterized protein n=1 Tax=Oryza glumipatula TaxID=40148 RepID=A0A0E0B405_9ORYZ